MASPKSYEPFLKGGAVYSRASRQPSGALPVAAKLSRRVFMGGAMGYGAYKVADRQGKAMASLGEKLARIMRLTR